jgi:6-phospho-beta-glucosidase
MPKLSVEPQGQPEAGPGLVQVVKSYETLTMQAAVQGSRELAMQALLAHPLVRDADIARPLLAEMLEANRPYLPQFFA